MLKCAALIKPQICNKLLFCCMLAAGFEMYRGAAVSVSAGSQHMKTIHIPKSMMSAPFLQVTHDAEHILNFPVRGLKIRNLNEITVIFLTCNKVSVTVSVSASRPYSWTETLPLQHSERLQHRAHEAADEAALSQCAAHMRSVRCVSTCL